MDGVVRLMVILAAALLVPKSSSQVLPLPQPRESAHPLCISQLALANQACASIPFRTVTHSADSADMAGGPAPAPHPAMDQLYHKQGRNHRHRHHEREDEDEHDHDHDHEHSHEHEHEHKHKHKSKRGNDRHHSNHHHHGNHHKGRHHGTEECCRWLKAMDDRCVCSLLLRLPAFLSGPAHGYTVSVDDDCEVEFECPGRFMQT